MRILHTESSKGWGGQEIRILREAEGMRTRGHEILFAVAKGSQLAQKAREKGFSVDELCFEKKFFLTTIPQLLSIMRHVDIVNTHSSSDAWIAGVAARIAGKRIIRTRHLSTPTKGRLNRYLLYRLLADYVVSTSSCILSSLPTKHCRLIATGVEPETIISDDAEKRSFRSSLGIKEEDFLVGTCCVVRSWKGIGDFLRAALLLKEEANLKWVIIGGGQIEKYKEIARRWGLEEKVFFTGHLERPFNAIGATDLFLLLSTANEGISQALLQAAALERPLIATTIGGSPEVCLENITGILVPPVASEQVADAIMRLKESPSLRAQMGRAARSLVLERFTWKQTLEYTQEVYDSLHLSHASRD